LSSGDDEDYDIDERYNREPDENDGKVAYKITNDNKFDPSGELAKISKDLASKKYTKEEITALEKIR